ncbi:hypothetical protein PSACC_02860 [Paramicrosporidium saccamoebae]|uniref:Uncharacterized protein n=1 Tax=Paramicrosporidium saccamoebae TaxID=1246581 RepID=A0A2H9THZ0_9FUNG|nr:hypothetical protein PSACC_02860 [Paramicrosporidium saccamoebae]
MVNSAEDRISELKSSVTWNAIRENGNENALTKYVVHEGTVSVPSSYERGVAATPIPLYVQKFTTSKGVTPIYHLIFMAGGPGGNLRDYDALLATFLNRYASMACYTYDQRGVGKSALISNLDSRQLLERINEVAQKAPFPLKDLTMTNDALDVGMLTAAIRASPDWSPTAKLILFGSSYGGQLAHHVVEQLPNTYDHVFALMPYRLGETGSASSYLGVLEACDTDVECRRRMGGNVKLVMEEALRNIANPKYNECTAMLHASLKRPLGDASQGTFMLDFINMFVGMITNKAPQLANVKDLDSIQVIMAMIKATNDCRVPSAYKEQVLKAMAPYTSSSTNQGIQVHSDQSDVNILVNTMVTLDTNFDFVKKGKPSKPSSYLDLAPDVIYPFNYYPFFERLKSHLGQAQRSVVKPIDTPRTAVHIANGSIDMITTPHHAYARFQAAKAPVKSWVLFKNGNHDLVWGRHAMQWFQAAIEGYSFDHLESEIAAAAPVLDWTFSAHPQFAPIWNQVRVGEDPGRSLKESLPAFAYYNKDGKPENFIYWRRPSFWVMVGSGLCLAIVSVALVTFWAVKKRRRPAAKESQTLN